MRTRERNRDRNFNLFQEEDFNPFDQNDAPIDYAKMRVGLKSIEDAIVSLGTYKKSNPKYGDKAYVLKAISDKNYDEMRNISLYYYESCGIYERLCKYLAFLYKYDTFVIPFALKQDANGKVQDKMLAGFAQVLNYIDMSNIKKLCGNLALEVIRSGSYYGYVVDLGEKFVLQQLPSSYCRSRYSSGTDQIIELNLKFFDKMFTDVQYRLKVLSAFPKEIQKGYVMYKEGKLPKDYQSDEDGWLVLDPDYTVKFNLNDSDIPTLVNIIPSIIDLDQAQELDRKKAMQQLLKIVIQKLPLDKNGELIFDMEEMRDFHNNAVSMLKRAIGIDVLTTVADVDVADMKDKNTATSTDDLMKAERTVYNNTGIAQNLFNTDGNLSLEKSILNDEASMRDLLYQFQIFLNKLVKKFSLKNQFYYKVEILETTIYNYREMAKMYKEMTQIGYPKLLPQVALGHSQANILATMQFENNILHLSDLMIPPRMSSTMSSNGSNNNNEGGRPEKPDDEKSDKTIQNKEAM